MNNQEYWCERCGINGGVVVEDHADVYTVLNQLGDDHKKHSPGCPCVGAGLRVVTDHVEGQVPTRCEGDVVRFRYLAFFKVGQGEKTTTWSCRDSGGVEIGRVKYYGRWRQYCYFTVQDAVYSAGCHNDISTFLRTAGILKPKQRPRINDGPSQRERFLDKYTIGFVTDEPTMAEGASDGQTTAEKET